MLRCRFRLLLSRASARSALRQRAVAQQTTPLGFHEVIAGPTGYTPLLQAGITPLDWGLLMFLC